MYVESYGSLTGHKIRTLHVEWESSERYLYDGPLNDKLFDAIPQGGLTQLAGEMLS